MSSGAPPPEPPDRGTQRPRVRPSDRRVLEPVRRVRPGDAVVRVRRARFQGFSRKGEGHLEAGPQLEEPKGLAGALKRWLVGAPIHSALESHERLGKRKALAVFSSDALSSVAYTPQETLVILLSAGVAAAWWSLPIALGVVLLLAIVVTSYRQTIYAYPSGGGSYIVAHRNLGELPGLVAAAALVVGYTLTVSVSIASAVDQLVSAVPDLVAWRVLLGVSAVGLITIANLRGIRESGTIFAAPTYIFLLAMFSLIGLGLVRYFSGELALSPPPGAEVGHEPFTLFLLLRAFAVASAVMTGTEAISNGIPAFKPPEPRNAARTLVSMALILGTMFLGLSVLIVGSGVIPSHQDTVISQLARAVFGEGPLYYLVQGSAVLILVLAANTAYADFPRLASLLARDNYAPHQLAFRGDRLAFSNGILLLGVLSALLIVVFGGSTGALLPLYALSVFSAFTLSQAGMVRHWLRERGQGWHLKMAINAIGASVTGLVAVLAASTNFMNVNLPIVSGLPLGWGAWVVLLVVPAFIWMFKLINRHYAEAAQLSALPADPGSLPALNHQVVVPVARLNLPTVRAVQYAASLSPNVNAVYVASDPAEAAELEANWERWSFGVPLTVVESPYRSLTGPLMQFLSELKRNEGADLVTVVLPEYVPDRWWEHILHGQSAQFLKLALLFTPGFVVTSVPTHEVAAR
ncbi:MAG: APC family permease [Chloroflexota bacterium]|nr:APC family permease [Chloroflexota bacterium]